MEEELLVSGRMNHLIDPQLNIWHWQIPLYLFLGGMAAGILVNCCSIFYPGKRERLQYCCQTYTLSCSFSACLWIDCSLYRPSA